MALLYDFAMFSCQIKYYIMLNCLLYSSRMASTSSTDENPSQSQIAQKTWEMANNIETISSTDEIYRYDRKQQQDILAAKPWEKECVVQLFYLFLSYINLLNLLPVNAISYCFSPHFFKEMKISALALLKMVMHARSGGTLEVMGLLLGKVDANTMMVMDSFALPVEGTETRVNAQAQAYEYMTAYIEAAKQVNFCNF